MPLFQRPKLWSWSACCFKDIFQSCQRITASIVKFYATPKNTLNLPRPFKCPWENVFYPQILVHLTYFYHLCLRYLEGVGLSLLGCKQTHLFFAFYMSTLLFPFSKIDKIGWNLRSTSHFYAINPNGFTVFFPSKALQEVLHSITEIFTPLDDDHWVLDLRSREWHTDWKNRSTAVMAIY